MWLLLAVLVPILVILVIAVVVVDIIFLFEDQPIAPYSGRRPHLAAG